MQDCPLGRPSKNKKALKVNTIKAFILFLVPTKGIEPSHPCEWQILSLLRLPIPPHGQLSFTFSGAAILRYPSNLSKIRCRYFFL